MSEAPARPIRPGADRMSLALAIAPVLIYVAAKAHFFVRFGEIAVSEYVAEHWPFWVAALSVALLGNVFERAHRESNSRQSRAGLPPLS